MSRASLWVFAAILVIMAAAASTAVEADTKSDCGIAQTAFGPCVPYMMGDEKEVSSLCCTGVKSIKDLSPTKTGRQRTCECLRTMMVQVGKIDSRAASGLAGKCRVKTNVIPTSLAFPCSKLA